MPTPTRVSRSPAGRALPALVTGSRRNVCLEVRFRWQGDRFGHALHVRRGDEAAFVLESWEGQAGDASPPSPPMQQVVLEQRNDRCVALGVGMAAGRHWSLSIEALKDHPQLIFQVACRTAAGPSQLGTCYGLPIPATPVDDGWRLEAGGSPVHLRPWEATRAGPVSGRGPHPAALEIVPAPTSEQPGTIRWDYSIQAG